MGIFKKDNHKCFNCEEEIKRYEEYRQANKDYLQEWEDRLKEQENTIFFEKLKELLNKK